MDAKKATNVRKPTTVKQGRVVKVGLNSTEKKLDAKVKAITNTGSVIVPSGTTLDVSGKVRKRKVDTHAEARFPCPIDGCKHKSLIIRYRTLFDHFADCFQPEGWESFRWWCDICKKPRYGLMGTDLVRHKQDYHGIVDWPTNENVFPSKFLSSQ